MRLRPTGFVWLALAGGLCLAGPGLAQQPTSRKPAPKVDASFPAPQVPLDSLPAAVREKARKVVEHPTLSAQGPVESGPCQPATYHWLLNHPDVTVRLWRSLDFKVADLQDQGNGRFGWTDGAGSAVYWDNVLNTREQKVWFAEGNVKPGLLIPAAPVQAIVLLNCQEGTTSDGRPAVRHQMSVIVKTDSKALALAARLMGGSAPKLAEQYLGQLQMFFLVMAAHLDQHPDKAEQMLREAMRPSAHSPTRSSGSGRRER